MDRLRILLIGSGGREHALAWKLAQSDKVDTIYVAPGNGGTAREHKVQNVTEIMPDDFQSLVTFARQKDVNLVIPGPEAPLVAGIEGVFRSAGIRCFGPSKAAARMEGSKTFAKNFMARHNIPTASYQNFHSYDEAKAYLDCIEHKLVIKASGLAAGKGVIIPSSKEEAHEALKEIMLKKEFGTAGDEVVIEEYLEGQELSFLTFSDGYTIRSLPAAQDHKQILDGDCGPNTGGMGCYAPTKIATPELIEDVHRRIIQPTVDGMRKEAFPFVGMLFTGLMVTKSGPMVLEYNVRFGDPETQTVLPLLSDDTDLAEILIACTDHWLDALNIKVQPKFSATIVASAGGYPGPYVRGDDINLGETPKDTLVFHAGTAVLNNVLKTSGGRVIAATSTGSLLQDAVERAYTGIRTIQFSNMHYRSDIGHRDLARCQPLASSISDNANGVQESMTYASAGVSVSAGNELVRRIGPLLSSTARSGTSATIGGFGGLFDLSTAGYQASPIIIGAIDGVGTKLHIAHALRKHDTVGIDLVAMNVNDLVVQGAEALFFLDCYSCGKLDVDIAADFVKGVVAGCKEAGCALIGGETAEMPGLFSTRGNIEDGGVYDAVGAAIGAIENGKKILPDKKAMVVGDVLLGLASNGCHSNGFSLIRKILERNVLSVHDRAPWGNGTTVGEELLRPTRIYVKPLLRAVKKDLVKGMAHITGGGLIDNIPRMLPKHLAAEILASTWHLPEVFSWLKKVGDVDELELARTFNTGLGMVLVVSGELAQEATKELEAAGERVFEIGKLVERKDEGCVLRDTLYW